MRGNHSGTHGGNRSGRVVTAQSTTLMAVST
jgi:hypothetical protein